MSYVHIRNLGKRFETTPVFEGIDLDINQGEMCVLVGPSGCGKTTLLRAIAGLVTPDNGSIAIDGADDRSRPANGASAWCSSTLFPNMTVEQNPLGLNRPG
jgi:ABC-type Fe3+/spermidine/putrescine transport system ATPase subunit